MDTLKQLESLREKLSELILSTPDCCPSLIRMVLDLAYRELDKDIATIISDED